MFESRTKLIQGKERTGKRGSSEAGAAVIQRGRGVVQRARTHLVALCGVEWIQKIEMEFPRLDLVVKVALQTAWGTYSPGLSNKTISQGLASV